MPPEQIDEMRPMVHSRLKNPQFREQETVYLAWLNGEPVAQSRLMTRAALAYLGGAATLSAARGQRVYSTLLRRRLEDARARGYHIAAIDAGPMSRRVVEKYGFHVLGYERLYAWMPVIDMNVIRTLIPND
jgi:predicted GNAT family N-acyltransferase